MRTLESLYWYGARLLVTPFAEQPFGVITDQWEPYEMLDNAGSCPLPPPVEALKAVVEALPDSSELVGQTRLLIVPGYSFKMSVYHILTFCVPNS